MKDKFKSIVMDYKFNSEYIFNVGGSEIHVNYKGLYNGLVVHFEFKGQTISPTAYKSHFVFVDELLFSKYSTILEIAKALANDFYQDFKKNYLPENFNQDQLTLF